MSRFLRKVLRVEESETSSLLWIISLGVFIGIAISLFDLASVSVFLEHFNKTYLPGAMICSGLLTVFISNTFISIYNWISFSKVSIISSLVLLVIPFSILLISNYAPGLAITYIAFVLTGPLTALALLLFWGLFERLFDLAQGRRLSMSAESGMVVAMVSILSVVALSEHSFFNKISNLYLISCISFGITFFVFIAISIRKTFLTKIEINVQYIKAYNNYNKLIKQNYTLLLILFALLSGLTFYFTEYFYLVFVEDQYASAGKTIDFLSGFSAAIIGLGFLLQLFAARWVNAKYGYLTSLLILPGFLALFTTIFLVLGIVEGFDPTKSVFFFLFMLVCISKLLSVSLFKSLEFSTFKFFFMPLDHLLRSDVQSKIERVVREAGKAVTGLLLIIALRYIKVEFIPVIILVLLGVWAYVAIRMNNAYREKLVVSLDMPEEIEKKDRAASGIIDELSFTILNIPGKNLQTYLNLLKILDPHVHKGIVLELLKNEDEEILKIALNEASELCLLPAIPVLSAIKNSRFYPVLRCRDLLDKVYTQLNAAEFRLEKVKYIEQLTLSKLRRERVYGALLSAYSEDAIKPRLLNKLFRDVDGKVRYNAVVSSANSANSDLQKNLIEKLSEPFYSNGALAALVATGEKILPAAENAFYLTGQEEKIQLRIVQGYGRMGTENAVQLLLKKLSYRNHNVARAAFEALSQSGYNITGDRVIQFKAELEEYTSVLVWNMSVYLDLVSFKASDVIIQAMLSEIESNYDSIFKLLSLLYDPKTIALIKENIFSKDAEKSEYAFGLLEVTLGEEMKPFLLPILNTASYEDKLERMQEYFPSEPLDILEILYDLVQRDYKYVNRWTKACALKELAEQKEEINTDIFVANIINPDPLLKETASVALYIKAPHLFPIAFERFRRELGANFSKDVVSKILISNVSGDHEYVMLEEGKLEVSENKELINQTDAKEYFSSPNLKFEIIRFLKGVDDFRFVPGIILMEVAKVTSFHEFKQGEIIATFERPENIDYYFIRTGKIMVNSADGNSEVVSENGFVNNFTYLSSADFKVDLLAHTDCSVYKVKQEEFNEVMSFFEDIPTSIVKNKKNPKV
ncbi:hypothetical protein [Sporocytophaga myxococcoides]|uniref:hypothetical protein n=1 Tax=Sporocytophaga myxococcoides TaxID=153721 RepID=UPI0004089075|nr:hypothetical protein [Sporocytophaga myxococcoides]